MNITVRPPAVAGFFYPDRPDALAHDVDRYLAAATDHGLTPKALIAPHAGYRYSAAVAASAYAGLRRLAGQIRRVVLLGPAHRVPLDGLAVPSVGAFATPLGVVPIDGPARAALVHLPVVEVNAAAPAPAHRLEVHLPFLQRVLGRFSLLPLAVGRAEPAEVADVIERCWGGPETLIVVSSDLSHYHDYETARRLDAVTARAIEESRAEGLQPNSACGVRAVAGLLLAARRRGMRAVTLDVRNSGDTEGDRERVVGYGAWAVVEASAEPVDGEDGRLLVSLARAAIDEGVRNGSVGDPPLADVPPRLRHPQAAFVTLEQQGSLRGCVGGVEPVRPLATAVVRAACSAALADPRFAPLDALEVADLTLSVSVLSPLERWLASSNEELLAMLEPGLDGLVLTEGVSARGVFLPKVWDHVRGPDEFVARLKVKAGLAPDHWSPTLAVHRFTTEGFA